MAALEEQKASADQSLEQHIAHIIDQQIFHPPNLLEDDQLRQNIDNNGFMPLAFITGNPLINTLTSDVERIKRAVSLCHAIQLMEDGRTIKVDLNPKRTTLILRDQPNNATQKDIEQIFSDPNCAKFREMRPDISNTWFVTFDSEDDCMKTVMYLQHERNMSVGVKTSVHPLAERMESPVAQRQRSIASPTVTTSAAPAPPDIIATGTISPSSGPTPEFFDAMNNYRNPYALLSTSGPPLGPVYARDPAMQAPLHPTPPPMIQSPQREPVMYQRPVDVQPTTEPAVGDYQKKFRHYNLQQLVDVYQAMYKSEELVKPPEMNDSEFVTERQESTMVQQPRNPRPKPRAEKTARRRSPRGKNRSKRGGAPPQQRPPPPVAYPPQDVYPPSYYYPQPQPPEQFFDQGGFYDTFSQPHYGYPEDYDDGYEEPPERRPQRRRSPRGQNRRGRGGGRGRGGRSGRQQRPRKEYRPVGGPNEYDQPDAAYESINGSPKRQNKGKSNPRSPANSRRGSKRGKRKLVYRPKESS